MASDGKRVVTSEGPFDVGDAGPLCWHEPSVQVARGRVSVGPYGVDTQPQIACWGFDLSRGPDRCVLQMTGSAFGEPDEIVVNGRRYVPAEEG